MNVRRAARLASRASPRPCEQASAIDRRAPRRSPRRSARAAARDRARPAASGESAVPADARQAELLQRARQRARKAGRRRPPARNSAALAACVASNAARAATASAPSHVLGGAPSSASAAERDSRRELCQAEPRQAEGRWHRRRDARARSSAAPRVAPTIRSGLSGAAAHRSANARQPSAADGDTSRWKRDRDQERRTKERVERKRAHCMHLLSRTPCRVSGYGSTTLPSARMYTQTGLRAQRPGEVERLRRARYRGAIRAPAASGPEPSACCDTAADRAGGSAALPELERVRDHAVAAPPGGPRHVVAVGLRARRR